MFEINIPPLQTQKHHRELEIIVQECILNTVRDSIPVEAILQAYMDETVEEHVVEEIREQEIEDPTKSADNKSLPPQIISETKESEMKEKKEGDISEEPRRLESDPISTILEQNKLEADLVFPDLSEDSSSASTKLSFNDMDFARDENNNEHVIEAPKTIDRLEEISSMRNMQRKMDEDDDDDDDDNVKLQIFDQDVKLDNLDIHTIDVPEFKLEPDLLLDDIEVLE